MKNSLVYKLAILIVFWGIVVSFPAGASILSVEKPSYSLGRGDVLYVGGSGEGNYTRIQDAIDNSSDGDTVFVFDDMSPYLERLVINKSLSLIGEGKESTVIDGEDEGTVIDIHAVDGCLIYGFTIQNCPSWNNWQFAVVKIQNSENVTVEDNILSIGYRELKGWVSSVGLYESKYCTVRNNHMSEEEHHGSSVGIVLRQGSSHNTISGNNISTYVDGIRLWHTSGDNNTISGNYLHYNLDGIDCSGKYHTITNNTIQHNTYNGIDCGGMYHSTISGNRISHNGDGGIIVVYGTIYKIHGNVISDNVIAYNNPCGLYVLGCIGNVIERNNFIDNKGSKGEIWEGNAYFIYDWRDFFVHGGNTWRGNYWSNSLTGGLLPKAISGECGAFFLHYWFEIDWHPAREPYDIGASK